MFKLSRKKLILRFLSIATLIIAVAGVSCAAIIKNNQKSVNAAEEYATVSHVDLDGDGNVNDGGDKIYYGNGLDGDGWTTRLYRITRGGTTLQAYCAQPRQDDPTFPSNNSVAVGIYGGTNANAIKLLMYMLQNNAFSTQINNYYSSLGATTNNLKYAWTHDVIGDLYGGDTYGLSDSEITIVRNIESQLRSHISNKDSVWRIAQNYTIYEGKNTLAGHQNVVWLEGSVQRGSITIQKCDSLSRECQVEGINFGVYNNTGITIYDPSGNTYANGARITSGKTGNDGKVTFSNLLVGFDYTVKEESTGTTNTKFALTAPNQNVSLTMSNKAPTLKFYNRPARGDVKFVKLDENNNQPMANVLFSITPLYDDGTLGETHYVVSDQNGVVDTSANAHSNHTNGYDALVEGDELISYQGFGTWFIDKDYPDVAIDDSAGALPLGQYLIEEMRCPSNMFCYGIKDQKKTISVTKEKEVVDLGNWNNACAVFELETEATDNTDGDHYVEAINNAKIKDTISYCVKTNTDFVIKGILMDKKTGEPLLINGKTVESSINLNVDEECGTTEMFFDLDATELGSKEVVVFETLYYEGEPVVKHEDINDDAQTVYIIKLRTIASAKESDEKVLPITDSAELKDVIDYCLEPGIEYTIKTVVMDKDTKNGILIDSKPVEQSLTFTPEEACGKTVMYYDLDTSRLGGARLVIFESLYIEDELILEHKDFDNEDESFSVEVPAPDTGVLTKTSQSSGQMSDSITTTIVVTIISAGSYLIMRCFSRKKSLRF